MKRRVLAIIMSLVLMIGILPVTALAVDDFHVSVLWYDFSDAYLSVIRDELDNQLEAANVSYTAYDAACYQAIQNDQIETAIAQGTDVLLVNIVDTAAVDAAQHIVDMAAAAELPVIFFNREVSDEVINSYENACFVGTNFCEAGGKQGKLAADYILENYDKVDLNDDGQISYIMMKGELGNPEAEARTRFAVEFCNNALTAADKPELVYYDSNNEDCFQPSNWSKTTAFELMETALSTNPMDSENPIEVVFTNNDDAALGCVEALYNVGWNRGGGNFIPVFGIDGTAAAMAAMEAGKMTGTVTAPTEDYAETLVSLVNNVAEGENVFAGAYDDFVVDDDCAKIRVPYDMILEGEVYETDYDYDYDYDFEFDGWYEDFEGASGECGNDLTWVLDSDGVLTISGTGEMYDFENYGENPAPWCDYRYYITEIIMEEGVTYIGENAFENCDNAQSISIPNTVTRIGNWAISWCPSLSELYIPASVTYIGVGNFQSCENLSAVWVDENNPAFASDEIGAMYDKSMETLMFVPRSYEGVYSVSETVTVIDSVAFDDCAYITEIKIPAGVTEIYSLFQMCYELSAITVHEDNEVYSTENGALLSKDGSILYVVPRFVDGEFIVPDGVEVIAHWSINGFESLTSLVIPESVVYIEYDAIVNSHVLENIIVDEDNEVYSSEDGVLFSKDKSELICVPGGKTGSYTVPASVETIGYDAFWQTYRLSVIIFEGSAPECDGYIGLEEDTVVFYPENDPTWTDEAKENIGYDNLWISYDPENPDFTIRGEWDDLTWALDENGVLTVSGEGAINEDFNGVIWNYSDAITAIVIEEGITSVGDFAFNDLYSLTEVSLPESLTYIGDFAFSGCYELGIVDISANVEYIGDYAFAWCDSFEGFNVDEENRNYSSDESGVLFDKSMTALIMAPCALSGIYEIPEGVEVICVNAFNSCYALTELIIPDSVISIQSDAIVLCDSLTSITIPKSVENIDASAINSNYGLKNIIVDEENPYYCNDEFGVLYSKDMKELILAPTAIQGTYQIPDGVEIIDNCAFSNCILLDAVTIPDSVENIGEAAFNFCTDLTSVTIPGSVSVIGHSAFGMCDALTEVVIGEGVVVIDEFAFHSCYNLQTITIPQSVTYIGNYAFDICYNLENINYAGSEADWGEIHIGYGNEYLLDAVDFGVKGDVDMNGVITNADLVMVARYIVGVESDNDSVIEAKGDVDGDGEVANADLVRIARIIVGA